MSDAPPRYLPSRPFPPYAYCPGENAHPTQDPEGHSRDRVAVPFTPLPPERWRENEAYLFGVDLYNAGYLWEAHEAWEDAWHPTRAVDPIQGEFLQGLIQCAAACLKIPMGQPRGLQRLAELSAGRLEAVARAEGRRYMGLDPAALAAELRAFAASEPTDIEGRPRLVLG